MRGENALKFINSYKGTRPTQARVSRLAVRGKQHEANEIVFHPAKRHVSEGTNDLICLRVHFTER